MKQFISQPFHCLAACIEYVVYHKSNISISQSTISEYFGISLPFESFNKVSIINKRITEDPNLWGISINSNDLNNFFIKNHIPLEVKYSSSLLFEDWSFEDHIKSFLLKGELLICTIDFNYLFDRSNPESFGHAIVLDSIHNNNFVKCYDPGPANSGYKLISIYDLFIASKRKKGGLFNFY